MSTPAETAPQHRTPTNANLAALVEPASAQEIADILASCASSGQAVVPVGGRGALALGNLTSSTAIGVSTKQLNRIVDYQPTDMTLAVQAGATLQDVADVLAEHGQMLPIEAPNPANATIGGLLATALTGPRRYGGGTLRDVIIGITVAYPDGTIGKAGGLVVKNVSGFDMMRIHYGALGTLGIILGANFKILPLARSEFTIIHPLKDLQETAPILTRLRAPSLRPVAMVVQRAGDGWLLAARFEGRESGLKAVAAALGDVFEMQDRRHDDASVAYWRQFMDHRVLDDQNEVRIQLSTLPTEIVRASGSVRQESIQAGFELGRLEIEPGVGLATISWQSRPDADAAHVRRLRAAMPNTTVSVLTAPDTVKATMDVWGGAPEAIRLMRRLKHEFDPNQILNPGRFAGMI